MALDAYLIKQMLEERSELISARTSSSPISTMESAEEAETEAGEHEAEEHEDEDEEDAKDEDADDEEAGEGERV